MADEVGFCYICGIDINNGSASSSTEHFGMAMTYVGGNGKRRLYCLACIAQALHVYTMVKPEVKKFVEYEIKRDERYKARE